MKRVLIFCGRKRGSQDHHLVLVMTCTVLAAITALSGSSWFEAAAQSKPAVAAIPTQNPIAAANRLFEQAWGNRDKIAVEGMLDAEFTWIDSGGVLLNRAEVLASWPTPAAQADTGEVKVQVYGARVALLQIHAEHTYVLRIWASDAKLGWRLLHVIESVQMPAPRYAVIGQADKTGVLPSQTGVETECINPCRVIPFRAPTQSGRAAISSWQQMEIGAVARDMKLWGYHVAEEAIVVDSAGDGTMTKAQYIADATLQKEAGVKTNEASPLLWGYTYDFSDIVLMLALHQPYLGQPFYATRLFVNREGRYQMVASYFTGIRDVPSFTLSDQIDEP